MDPDDFSIDALFADMPKENRLGFFTDSALDLGPEYAEVVAMLNELVAADEPYADEDGYQWQIIAHEIDAEHQRVAWVEWREKDSGRITHDNYYLKARDDAGSLLMWEIETYNPYFGCSVRFLHWVEDAVVIIYEDKHDTYAASLKTGADIRRIEIPHEWNVDRKVLAYHSKTGEEIKLRLPALERV